MAEVVSTAIYKMGLDAAQYKTEAGQVVAANQKIVASGEGVAISEQKVTQATRLNADTLDRKIARLDPLVAAQRRYANALEMVQRYETEGVGTAEQRARLIDLETQKYQQQIAALQRLTTVAAQVPVVDPTFGRLGQFGSVDSQRLVAGMTAAGAATATFRSGMKLTAFEMQNLSYQINDVVMGLATGQRPMTVAMQQGAQVAQIFGTRLKELPAALGAALLTPLGQVAVIIGVVTTGLAAMFLSERSHAKAAEDALQKHVDLINQIKEAYKDAGDAATRYGATSIAQLRALDAEQQRVIKEQLNKKALDITNPGGRYGVLSAAAGEISPETFAALKKLREEAATGSQDWKEFGDNIVQALNNPAISRGQRTIAQGFLQIAIEQAKVQAGLRTPIQVQPGPMTPNFPTQNDSLLEILKQRAEMERIRRGLDADLTAITARSPAQIGAAARAQGEAAATGHDAADQLKIEAAAALAAAQAEFQLSEARRQREATARDGLETSQMEVDLVGKGIAATTELRANWASYLELRREAEDNNVAFDDAQYERLKAINAEMAKLAELTARRQLVSDTSFDRSQLFRNSTEQDVADKMRGIYGDDYLSHMQDFEAQQVRINDRLKEMNEIGGELTQGAFHDFFDGIRNGEGAFQALGDAGVNALGKIQDKLIDMLADQAWNALFGQLGGMLGGALGGAGGAGAVLPGGTPLGQGGIGNALRVAGPGGSNVVPLRLPQQRTAGGAPSLVVNHTIVNHAGAQVTTRERQRPDGGIDMETIIHQAVDDRMSGRYGMRPQLREEAFAGS